MARETGGAETDRAAGTQAAPRETGGAGTEYLAIRNQFTYTGHLDAIGTRITSSVIKSSQ